jgi:hypothetical protein
MAVFTQRKKFVAVRHPLDVGRPGGKRKIKMVPYTESRARDIPHTCAQNGILMMEVDIPRDSEGRQIKFMRGEFRQGIAH